MSTCICDGSYAAPWHSKGVMWCWRCNAPAGKILEPKRKSRVEPFVPLVLPPKLCELTKEYWEANRPWINLSYDLVVKYGFYIGKIYEAVYLVMPITRRGFTVSFSARLLEKDRDDLRKYCLPKGIHKEYWLSSDNLSEGNLVFIAEGIADAAYLSQLGNSVALCGSHYSGEIDNLLRDKICVIMMDHDAEGFGQTSSCLIRSYLDQKDIKSWILSPYPKNDPTDLTAEEIQSRLRDMEKGLNILKLFKDV